MFTYVEDKICVLKGYTPGISIVDLNKFKNSCHVGNFLLELSGFPFRLESSSSMVWKIMFVLWDEFMNSM